MARRHFIRSLVCAALAAGVAFSAAACANAKKLYDGERTEVLLSSSLLDRLSGYTVTGVDAFGMISAQNGEGFALYSLPTNRFYTSETAFEKLSDGLYRSESGGEIAFYGRGGIAASVPAGTEIAEDGSGVFRLGDGRRLYVNAEGTAVCEEDSLRPALAASAVAAELSAYYLRKESETAYSAFDLDGNYKTTVDFSVLFSFPQSAEAPVFWQLNNKVFAQYAVPVGQTDGDYTFSASSSGGVQRVKLVTMSYDFATGRTKSYDLPLLVESAIYPPYSSSYVILSGYPVENRRLNAQTEIQAYKENLQIHVNLQELLPGASEILFDGDFVLLGGGGALRVYDSDGKRLGEYPLNSVDYAGQGILLSGSTAFTAEGEAIYRLQTGETFLGAGRDALYIRTSDGDVDVLKTFYPSSGTYGTETLVSFSASGDGAFYLVQGADGAYTLRSTAFRFSVFSSAALDAETYSAVSARGKNACYSVVTVSIGGAPVSYAFRAIGLLGGSAVI